MGQGIVAVDILETSDGGLLVSEVNHTPEFRNSIEPTGVDIPGKMVDHVLEIAGLKEAKSKPVSVADQFRSHRPGARLLAPRPTV